MIKYSEGARALIVGVAFALVAGLAALAIVISGNAFSSSRAKTLYMTESPEPPQFECTLKINSTLSEEEFLEKLKAGRMSVECEQK
ncbi:hypothetical protein OFY73_004385 [Salmonella enterica]|nr:hypothetical protein [Salmonella enterica subsp. enterica serovar Edinburgh]EBH8904686.1 hypothetical protein [Salmonella enterica subsp. enterica serovar 6,7:b:-]EBH8909789.1 hypothetical protein [Salmonella enterica subsp. enterica serovar Santiago]EHG2695330.1 hypothetical protein [Salmonella enterica]EBH8945915.1 hypothetical protein [Salmonella enterica subsp. enterica serovar 6,7:b:-]